MSYSQFVQSIHTDGLELALMYAEIAFISKAQIQLWLITAGVK